MNSFDRQPIQEYYYPHDYNPDYRCYEETIQPTKFSYIKVKSNLHIRKAKSILYRRMNKSVCSK